MFNNFFSGKRIFVTGHTGFKGSWLLVLLRILNAKVKGYALVPNEGPSMYKLIKGDQLCDSEINNINNALALENSIKHFNPDVIIHLAAQPLVRLSYEQPLETYRSNVIGTANLLIAAKKLGKKCNVVCITTDKVYYNREWEYPYRETDRLGGYDPYSSSKACAEILINSFRLSFFNPAIFDQHGIGVASARAGNVIGGGDYSHNRIIPDIVKAVSTGQEVKLRNPDAVRPWQHVIEPLYGYLKLVKEMSEDPITFSDAWNFGPRRQDNISVKRLAEIAIDKWGGGEIAVPQEKTENQPHEAKLLKLDISKTEDILGWKPVFDSEEAISLTLEWYKFVKERGDALEISQRQIMYYIERLNKV